MDSEMASLDESSSELSTAYSLSPPPDGSSSPLSVLSRSPTPPLACNYPSPPSSQHTSQNGSPCPDGMDGKEGQPPAKRRRISKERTTEYLDLSREEVADEKQLDLLKKVLRKHRKIVVVVGAGISVSAGIPDFRSKTGIFNLLKTEHKLKGSGKDMFDASVYRDHDSTTSFHSMVRDMSRISKHAEPTSFHLMLASLAQEGRLLRLYSQNVDGLEVGLGPLSTTVPLSKNSDGKWPKTVQLHGGLKKMVCMKCHAVSDLDAELFDGPVAPPCSACIGINEARLVVGKRSHGIGQLRPRMVLYSEPNPDEDAIGAVAREDLRRRPDAVIIVGTTLKVPGVRRIVREMCAVTRDHRDGVAVWINNDPPPPGPQFEDCFDLVVTGTADAVASQASLRPWDFPTHMKHEDPPSDKHFNNSYKPPSKEGSVAPAEHSSPAYSPLKSGKKEIVQSIETHVDGDDTAAGLPTPTKSVSGSSAKQMASGYKPKQSIFQQFLSGPQPRESAKFFGTIKNPLPPSKSTAGPTSRRVKAIAPGSKAKLTKKASKRAPKKQGPTIQLSSTFRTSKSTTMGAAGKEDIDKIEDNIQVAMQSTPRKQRLVDKALTASPKHQHTPSKKSPDRKSALFPGLARRTENDLPASG